MKKLVILLFSSVLFFSCSKDKSENVTTEEVTLKDGQNFEDFLKDYETTKTFNNNGVKFILATKKDNHKKMLFYTKEGEKNDFREAINFKGNLLDIFVADIDTNKTNELYITFAPMKGETYETVKDVDILGYTLNDNKEINRINIEDIEDLTDFNTDKVTLEDNILSRTYIDDGNEHKYNYSLKNYVLVPKKN